MQTVSGRSLNVTKRELPTAFRPTLMDNLSGCPQRPGGPIMLYIGKSKSSLGHPLAISLIEPAIQWVD